MSEENKKSLKDLLLKSFDECKKTPTDEFFCQKFMEAIDEFFSNGHVYTVDGGTVSGQPFVGVGVSIEGGIKGNISSSVSTLIPLVKLLKGPTANLNLANYLTQAIMTYISMIQITCSVVGTMIGTSKGSVVTFNIPPTLSALIYNDFIQMDFLPNETVEHYNSRLNIGEDKKYKDTDECLCDILATHIQTVMESCVINTVGQGTISGSTGVGTWSFEEQEQDTSQFDKTEDNNN